MNLSLTVFTPEGWKEMAENAHLVVFSERRLPDMNRIDLALLVSENDVPMSYLTARDADSETIYLNYGGSFPGTKGTGKSAQTFSLMLDFLSRKYKRATMLVENNNFAMLRLAMSCGWEIRGLRVFKESILLEHQIDFLSKGVN